MKWLSAVLVAILVGLLSSEARAAPANGISFDSGQPTSPAGGKVSATGSYTLAAGYNVDSIELTAAPAGGGTGGSVICMKDTQTKTWSGTIAGLPAGTYNVQAKMTATKLGAGTAIVFTPVAQVTVAAP